jgi:adenylate cyclase
MKRKIAAILAADVAGYSRLVADDEEEALRRLAAYRGIFDEFIANHGGRIFNTAGDAVLAEFASSVEAVRCAVEVQESLRTRNLAFPPSRQMLFRVGITIADVVERDGDLLGDGVNIAARLEGIADPGGICVSRAVYEQVANKISVAFTDIGHQSVKNIPEPVHAFVIPAAPGSAGAGKRRSAARAAQSGSYRLPTLVLSAFTAIVVSGALAWVILKPMPPVPTPTPTSAPATKAETTVPVAPTSTAAKPSEPPSPVKDVKSANGAVEPPASPTATATVSAPTAPAGTAAEPHGSAPATPRPAAETAPSSLPAPTAVSPPTPTEAKARTSDPAAAAFTWDPLIERPFDIRALPIVPLDLHASVRSAMAGATGHKALAVASNGKFAVGNSAGSSDEAVRQALDACTRQGSTCRVLAVDDKYVVPLPRTVFVRGIFDPLTADQVPAAERPHLAQRLAAALGWSAVAIGTSGRAGVGQGAANEADAIKAALADCAARDSNCRLIAIGPFRVERY